MLISFVLIGLSIDLGTDPSAAWCKIISIFSHALLQSFRLVISPSMNLKLESLTQYVVIF